MHRLPLRYTSLSLHGEGGEGLCDCEGGREGGREGMCQDGDALHHWQRLP